MKKNILLSGSHRSGTTWTGRVIAKARGVRYVDEPFNLEIKRKHLPFTCWFEYLEGSPPSRENRAADYLDSFYRIFHLRNIINLLGVRSLKDCLMWVQDLASRITDRSIVKDPIAIMSAGWIYRRYNWNMVILVRHPAAFIASIKVKNWQFDFNNYLRQEPLMKDLLERYRPLIEEYARNKKDIIDQGILLWNTIYDVVLMYREKYGDAWYFVRHEDLSRNPVPEFEKMFSYLGLKLDSDVKAYIAETTRSKNNTDLERDSVKNIKSWKDRLTAEEIARIKEGTGRVWPGLYTEDDW